MREMQANLFAVLILNDRLNLMFHYKVWYTKSLDGADYTWQVWYSSLSECSIQTICSKGTCIRNTGTDRTSVCQNTQCKCKSAKAHRSDFTRLCSMHHRRSAAEMMRTAQRSRWWQSCWRPLNSDQHLLWERTKEMVTAVVSWIDYLHGPGTIHTVINISCVRSIKTVQWVHRVRMVMKQKRFFERWEKWVGENG